MVKLYVPLTNNDAGRRTQILAPLRFTGQSRDEFGSYSKSSKNPRLLQKIPTRAQEATLGIAKQHSCFSVHSEHSRKRIILNDSRPRDKEDWLVLMSHGSGTAKQMAPIATRINKS